MNDNQIVNEDVILITDDEKNAVSSIVYRIVELIKEKHI
jgi:hypothetical protein